MFKKGDRVYHRVLKLEGIFIEYDWLYDDECHVDFGMDGHENYRCVLVGLLELIK